jgi:hypothetical protein
VSRIWKYHANTRNTVPRSTVIRKDPADYANIFRGQSKGTNLDVTSIRGQFKIGTRTACADDEVVRKFGHLGKDIVVYLSDGIPTFRGAPCPTILSPWFSCPMRLLNDHAPGEHFLHRPSVNFPRNAVVKIPWRESPGPVAGLANRLLLFIPYVGRPASDWCWVSSG